MNNGGQVFNRVTGTPINDVELSPRRGDVRPYMYRPNQVLVDRSDRAAVSERLTAAEFTLQEQPHEQAQDQSPAGESGDRPSAARSLEIERSVHKVLPTLGLELWVREAGLLLGGVRVPDLVADLRKVEVPPDPAAADEEGEPTPRTARVWPVYVAHGEPDGEFGPATTAQPVDSVGPVPQGNAGKGVRVGVVDTGVFRKHEWLLRAKSRGPQDDEILDDNGDGLRDFEASHGTFVMGLILRQAPGATVIGRAAVDSHGIVGDLAIAAAIESLRHEDIDILNLSLGGYVDPDDPNPFPASFRAIELLRQNNPNLIVVAAAGNDGISQEFYPAASPTVIGVGALTSNMRRACFSNFGPWVNAWAHGVDVESCFDLDHTIVRAGAIWSGTSFAAPRVTGAIAAAMNPA